METLELLARRIATTGDLQSIVRTMKSLSAVSIRQYEQAVLVLRSYQATVELGLQVLLQSGDLPILAEDTGQGATLAVVFGSDHGLCGRFNRQVAGFARQELRQYRETGNEVVLVAVGARVAGQLEIAGEHVEAYFSMAGSADGLTDTAHSLLMAIDNWRAERAIGRVVLYHNARGEHAAATPAAVQLLPLDTRWLKRLSKRRWHSRALPTYTLEPGALLAALVRQHLFVQLFHAAAESAASEHSTRLAAMKAAERSIKEHLEEMNTAYRGKRQEMITEEMLDVVAGFEALTTAE